MMKSHMQLHEVPIYLHTLYTKKHSDDDTRVGLAYAYPCRLSLPQSGRASAPQVLVVDG